MQEYWSMISEEYQQKLIALAGKHEVKLDTAMRNLVNCLQGKGNDAGNFKNAVTAKEIEEMIDTLTA